MAKSFPNTGATVGLAADRTAMTSMLEGQEFFETDTNKMFVYSGSGWVQTNSWSTTSGVTGVSNLIVPSSVRLDKAASQSIPNTTDTLLTWPTATHDTDGMYSAAATNQITINTAGIYYVSANVTFFTNATGERIAWIQSSGGTRFCMSRQMASTLGIHSVSISTCISLTATTILQVGVYQGSGGALNVLGTTTDPTSFTATRLGPIS